MLNYTSSKPCDGTIKVTGITRKADCRAYRVFAPWIKRLAQSYNTPENEIFKCETYVDDKGVKGATVFSCSLCKNKDRHTTKYNLFDGVRADGTVDDIGIVLKLNFYL
jgi:hypothetical protein